MNLENIININLINLNLKAESKEEVIDYMCKKLYDLECIDNLENFKLSVYEREKIGETGMGNKIAIPHGLSSHVIKPSVVIAKTTKPITWESLDNQPVELIFLLAAPTGEAQKNHLQMLAQLAAVLAYPKHIEALMNCNTELEFYNLFSEYLNERLKNK